MKVPPQLTGPLPFPRWQLNPELVLAVKSAMRAKRPKGLGLALQAGFPGQQVFSNQLNAEFVIATPLNIRRFERVAEIVGFTGDVFLPEGDVYLPKVEQEVAS